MGGVHRVYDNFRPRLGASLAIMTDCQICGSPGSMNLCRHCTRILQDELDKVPGLLEEFDARISKPVQNRYKVRLSGEMPSSDSAPPLDLDMASARRKIDALNARASRIAQLSDARSEASRTLGLIASAEDLLNDEPELRVWGTCPTPGCQATIKAPMDHRRTRCLECGWLQELSEMMNRRLSQLDRAPTPPRQTRETLAEMTGIRVTKKNFENWVYHRRLPYVLDHVGSDGSGRRLYRVRDLLLVCQSKP